MHREPRGDPRLELQRGSQHESLQRAAVRRRRTTPCLPPPDPPSGTPRCGRLIDHRSTRRGSRRSPRTRRRATSSRRAPGSCLPAAARSGNPPRRQRSRRAPSPAARSRRSHRSPRSATGGRHRCAHRWPPPRCACRRQDLRFEHFRVLASSRLTMLRKRSASIWYSNSRSRPSSDADQTVLAVGAQLARVEDAQRRLDGAQDERLLQAVVAQQADRAWHAPARATRMVSNLGGEPDIACPRA